MTGRPLLCAVCGSPGVIFCHDCVGTLPNGYGGLNVHKHWYCSESCKEFERDNHEQECSQIQNEILYTKAERAASVAQQVFYTLMEKTWTLDVGFIDYLNPNDALEWVQVQASIGAEEGPGGGSLQPRLAGGWLVKFPEQKINPDAKEAVLADRNSVWQFVAMHVTMSYLFRSLVANVRTSIKEVRHSLHPGLSRLVHYLTKDGAPLRRKDQPYTDNDHIGVYEITLLNGSTIAVNLAGKQFKHPFKTVMPWEEYWDTYADEMVERSEFGTAYLHHMCLMRELDCFSQLSIITHIILDLKTYLDNIERDARENRRQNPLSLLLDLTPAPLANSQRSLFLNNTHTFLAHRLAAIDANTYIATDIPLPTSTGSSTLTNPLRHPRHSSPSVFQVRGRDLVLTDFGPHVTNFHWEIVKELAKDRRVGYEGLKELREMLSMRCVRAPWGDHKIVLLPTMPAVGEREFVRENPFWDARRARGA